MCFMRERVSMLSLSSVSTRFYIHGESFQLYHTCRMRSFMSLHYTPFGFMEKEGNTINGCK